MKKGERISKTKKNGIPYDEAVETMTADAMRWLYCQQKPHVNVNFGYAITDNVKQTFLLILWNSVKYFLGSASNADWSPSDQLAKPTHVLDRWLLSRLNSTITSVTSSLEKYRLSQATETIEKFVTDLSTWYIRRSRDRNESLPYLYHSLKTLSVLIMPFIPYLSDTIYKYLNPRAKVSVHLASWPQADNSALKSDLEISMDIVRNVCSMAHALRQKAQLKVRQPLSTITIGLPKGELDQELIDVILEETNIKNATLIKTSEVTVQIDTNLTPELLEEGNYRDLVRSIQVLRKQQGLSITDRIRITAPSWPKNFQSAILEKTLADDIIEGPELKVEPSSA